jgi:4-hydroxybenzoate polyprenyltransferase
MWRVLFLALLRLLLHLLLPPQNVAQLLVCCMMSGPFLTGYTQTINDYYDREIDAINEPYRPIPSGGSLSYIGAAVCSTLRYYDWGCEPSMC